MQNKDIDIFLELVSTRSFTKASENLFISQSVISTRLKKLEEELGYELFVRSKGIREIELTRPGREFVSVAMRWKNLFEEAALLRDQTRFVLRIASPESVYFDFLEPLLMDILRKYPEIKVSAQTGSSTGIYELMEKGVIDFGFASYESAHSNVAYSHVYTQRFCLVADSESYSDYPEIAPDMLAPAKEIRLTGGNFTSVALWYDTWFPGMDRCRVEVDSPHMIVKSLRELGSWAILPLATAKQLAQLYGVRILKLSDVPESRKIYLLRHTGPLNEDTDAVRIFNKELELYLKERSNTDTIDSGGK